MVTAASPGAGDSEPVRDLPVPGIRGPFATGVVRAGKRAGARSRRTRDPPPSSGSSRPVAPRQCLAWPEDRHHPLAVLRAARAVPRPAFGATHLDRDRSTVPSGELLHAASTVGGPRYGSVRLGRTPDLRTGFRNAHGPRRPRRDHLPRPAHLLRGGRAPRRPRTVAPRLAGSLFAVHCRRRITGEPTPGACAARSSSRSAG